MADAEQTIEISYFGAPGRAEIAKLCLAIAGIPFKEDAFDFSGWKQRKAETQWGSCPYATLTDGTVIGQSRAMTRYFAKQAGLYPTCAVVAAKVDSVYDFMEDILTGVSKLNKEDDHAARKGDWAENGITRQRFMKLDQYIAAEGKDGFAIGNCLSLADLCVFVCATNITSGFFDHYPKFETAFESMENVRAVCEKVGGIQAVRDRYASEFPGKDSVPFKGFIEQATLNGPETTLEKSTWEETKLEGQPTLTYFNLPGRAEVIRVLYCMEALAGGIEDKMISFEEWPNLKNSGTIPLGGQLPTLTLPDGTILTQSLAITRYAAKKTGMYPGDDLTAQKADAVVDCLVDCMQANYIASKTGDLDSVWGEGKKCPMLLEKLEAFIVANDCKFAASDTMSYADVTLFLVCAIMGQNDKLEGYKKITEIRNEVLKNPLLAKRYKALAEIEAFKKIADVAGIDLS